MKQPLLIALLATALLSACATSSLSVDGITGESVSLHAMADELATKDVVFLGENHDSAVGHELQLEMVELLHEQRGDVAVAMEMFERDVQVVVDQYMAGTIDEATFAAKSRPWKKYQRFYRPIVEYARRNGLTVLAANLPDDLAKKVAKDGPPAVAGERFMARETSAPRDDYFERFVKAIAQDESQREEEWVYRYYQAQCLKDDTMAETIVDYIRAAARRGERPLVVHLCGKFHSDFGEGTAGRVAARAPELDIGIVTMAAMPVVSAGSVAPEEPPRADFVWAVRAEPSPAPRPAAPTTAAPAHGPVHGPSHGPVAAGDRPALGFMPDYTANAVVVETVVTEGPAERAGFRTGDVVAKVGDRSVGDLDSYMDVLAGLKIGEIVPVVLLRDGDEVRVRVVVGKR